MKALFTKQFWLDVFAAFLAFSLVDYLMGEDCDD